MRARPHAAHTHTHTHTHTGRHTHTHTRTHTTDSVYAINIKACNHYKLYNGAAAETELKALSAATGTPIGRCLTIECVLFL